MSVSYGALKDFSFGEDHAPARHSVTVGGSIAQKQNELRDATEARIRALEARGRKAEQDLSQERASLKALTADFEYNLNLIKERDDELEKFEEAMETMKLAVEERDREVVDTRIALENTQTTLLREQKRAAEAEQHYQAQLLQLQSDRDVLKTRCDAETREKAAESETLRKTIADLRERHFHEARQALDQNTKALSDQILDKETQFRGKEEQLREQAAAAAAALAAKTAELEHVQQAHRADNASLREQLSLKTQEAAALSTKNTEMTAELTRARLEAEHLKAAVNSGAANQAEVKEVWSSVKERFDAEKRAWDAERAQLAAGREALADDLRAAKADLADTRRELKAAEADGARMRDQLAAGGKQSEELGALRRECDHWKAAAAEKDGQLASKSEQLSALTHELQQARTARDAAAAEAAERLRKLESSREAHRADVAAKEESQKAAEAAFQRERDEHARTVEKLTLGIQALQQDGRAWQQRAESLEPAAVAAQNSSNDLVSARDQLRSSENFRRSETDKYESTIRRLQKKLAESTSRHESLRAVAQQLQLQLQASAPGLGSSTASTTLLAQTLASILAPAAAGSPGSAYWRQPDAFPPVDPFGDNSDPSDDGGGGDNRAYNNDRKATGGDCEYPPVSPLAAPVTPVLSSTYHHHQAQQQARHLQKLRDRQKAALEERAGRAEADAAHRARVIEDLRAQVADHATRNQDLSAQNDRIRAQVRKFTEEMEAEPIVQKTKQLRAEADELRAQLNAKKRDVAALQAHVMDLESAASRGASSGQPELLARAAEELAKVKAELELHKKRSALLEALNDHTTSAAAQHILAETDPAGLARALAGMKKKYEKAKHAAKELAGEGKDLRKRLDRAHADLKRVAAEKRSLLEINNMLRSDLSKLASADLSPQSFSPRTTTALLPSRLAP
ncbi:hypothetical protein DIPPA_15301 [Diplonema papillatum]|nr:hypothetical protein DIPPA_15301 [Diplonema papillatum]